jgi:hypothetical protein
MPGHLFLSYFATIAFIAAGLAFAGASLILATCGATSLSRTVHEGDN